MSRDVSIETWKRKEQDARRIPKRSDIDVWENSSLFEEIDELIFNAYGSGDEISREIYNRIIGSLLMNIYLDKGKRAREIRFFTLKNLIEACC